MEKSLLEHFRIWLRLFLDFLKRTREQYALEFNLKKGKDWGKGPHVHKLQATYKFEVEHRPLNNQYFPVVTITEKKWEERKTSKDRSPHNQAYYYEDQARYTAIGIIPQWPEPSGHWVTESREKFIYLVQESLTTKQRVEESDYHEVSCLNHEEALKVIALYKERFLRHGITTKHVETVNVIEVNKKRVIVDENEKRPS